MEENTQAPQGTQAVDLLVGIPTYNHARTLGNVVRTVSSGLRRYFPEARAMICVSDGGSTDGTREEMEKVQPQEIPLLVTAHAIHALDKMSAPYRGILGQEKAYRTFLETAQSHGVKACAVVDPDLQSITPEWMEGLLRPVVAEGFDFVSPLFTRKKFDGTITQGIVYPLTRALYGKRVSQPLGGNLGFSRRLVDYYLSQAAWESAVLRLGTDIWMTTLAVAGEFKVCQACLGVKIHEAQQGPAVDLATLFSQVISSVYTLMAKYQDIWKGGGETQTVPTFGEPQEIEDASISVNWERMMRIFRLAVKDLMEIWRRALPGETAHRIASIGRLSDRDFHFPPDLWVHLVYDFAVAYQKGAVHRDHLLKSMVPLYLGWVASFIKENGAASAREVEERVEALCRVFEEMKPYLTEHWPR